MRKVNVNRKTSRDCEIAIVPATGTAISPSHRIKPSSEVQPLLQIVDFSRGCPGPLSFLTRGRPADCRRPRRWSEEASAVATPRTVPCVVGRSLLASLPLRGRHSTFASKAASGYHGKQGRLRELSGVETRRPAGSRDSPSEMSLRRFQGDASTAASLVCRFGMVLQQKQRRRKQQQQKLSFLPRFFATSVRTSSVLCLSSFAFRYDPLRRQSSTLSHTYSVSIRGTSRFTCCCGILGVSSVRQEGCDCCCCLSVTVVRKGFIEMRKPLTHAFSAYVLGTAVANGGGAKLSVGCTVQYSSLVEVSVISWEVISMVLL